MARLTIYGDFNCPFSALASDRADVLLARRFEIDWRAVQHDVEIAAGGEIVDGDFAVELAAEVASVMELGEHDVGFRLVTPPVRSNTAAACATFAATRDDRDGLRRRLFAAVWSEGRNVGERSQLKRLGASAHDTVTARDWQTEFDALPRPVVPTLVLPDGYVSRGLGALARLAEMSGGSGS